MGTQRSRLSKVKAVLFDMHLTITQVNDSFIDLSRKVAHSADIDLSQFTDDEIWAAHEKFDAWFHHYQIEHDVDIHYGNEVEHWTEANRVMFEILGFEGLSDDELVNIEMEWKEHLRTWETIRPDAKAALVELHKRGYRIGICTRRPDDPTYLLREWEILDILATVQWTAVPGYAKPYPYSLILAADEIGTNPMNCLYVGNSIDSDIIAAQRAGMTPVLTTWSNTERVEKISQEVLIIHEVSELLDLLPGIA